ncbi:MAG: germination protein YpeB [Clostridia bacterium]|nr:germination protein YpeB [Clostridia bacterium]
MEEKRGYSRVIIYIILALALVAAVLFAIFERARANDYENDLEINYQRAFTEMVQYIDDLEITLEKSLFVNDTGQMIRLSGEIYRQAADAKACLAMFPLGTEPLEKLSEFLSQVGDYAYSLSLKMLDGDKITDDEYANLKTLKNYASVAAVSLDGDLEKVYSGTLSVAKAASGEELSQLAGALGEVEEQMHDYPALIYDGPFSSHLTDKEPTLTKGQAEIDENEAISIAKSIVGEAEFEISEESGILPMYYLSGEIDNKSVTMGITKSGGFLEYYLVDREVGESAISVTDARLAASEFLESIGYSDMTESYYESTGENVVINFAAEQEGYTLYPDLVKVKVALDTGEIIGLEARGYIMYHQTRDIPKIKVSAEEAKSKVNPNVEIASVTRAVIPLDNGSEEFCWQIEGRIDERRCLIYINTQTGAEEKLFLLIESESGVLAV